MCAAAAAVAVVAVVVAAAVAAAAAAATELLPLPTCARVQPGSVQSVVQLCALKLMLCAGSCARPGLRVSAQAAGAGQQVQGGLAEPPAGVRGSLGVAQRRAWAVRAQRHLTFAVLSIHSFNSATYTTQHRQTEDRIAHEETQGHPNPPNLTKESDGHVGHRGERQRARSGYFLIRQLPSTHASTY